MLSFLYLTKVIFNNIKFILLCVFLLGVSDAGWNSLFPSYLIEKGFTDKDVGQINFISRYFSINHLSFCWKIN